MKELEILKAIEKNNNSIEYIALLNLKRNTPGYDALSMKYLVQHLKNQRYISGYLKEGNHLKLTPAGFARIDELEGDERIRKEQYRHNWKVAIFSALVGAFLSQPLWGCLEWVAKFLQNLAVQVMR